ncbi:MAG: hypothetical protein H7068_11125, partial [Pedobacter sp.]|nr:hypothetical protein [Chitinophagaceae bacterium]
MKKFLALIILVIVVIASCKNKAKKPVVVDATITQQTSFNNLFFDSIQLEKFIASDSVLQKFKQEFFDFYKHRNYEFAWFDTTGLVEQAHNFYNLQNSYITNVKDSTIYNARLQVLYTQLDGHRYHSTYHDTLAFKTEMLLTGQFFKYASKVYQGSDINAKELGWFIPRKKIDITAALDSMVKAKGKAL